MKRSLRSEKQQPASQNGPALFSGSETDFNFAECMTHASIDGMVALDITGKIVAWNKTVASWTGFPFEEVAGRDFLAVFPDAAKHSRLQNALQQALQGYKSFLHSKGDFCIPGYYETHIVPMQAAGTEDVKGILVILHDVAHRVKTENQLKALNEQLLRQNAALQQANEELAAFAKIAAHDLKEPLRKIYTFAELIMMRESAKLSKDGRANFRRIQKSVQRMGLLTDDLVNFSEMSRSVPFEPVDLSALLGKELLFYQEEIARTEAIMQVERLPVISGNPTALQQMLRQLLSNAFKFRRPDVAPHIRISCKMVDYAAALPLELPGGQPYCCITVTDNGIGFDPGFKSRIFELFQRLHPEGTYPGSGMGLAIVRKAAHLHGGFVEAESVPGEGSTFCCFLPLQAEV